MVNLGGLQITMIVLVSPTLVLMAAHCVVLTERIGAKHICGRFITKCQNWGIQLGGGRLKFVFWNHRSRASGRSAVLSILFGGHFLPVMLLLVIGGAELLLGMDIIGNLNIAGEFR